LKTSVAANARESRKAIIGGESRLIQVSAVWAILERISSSASCLEDHMTSAALAAPKVFVVDDDEAVRDAIKGLLVLYGLDVEDFGSTADFMRGYRKPSQGCLILDQHLPRTSGLEFLASREGRSLGIPVILITGQGNPNIARRAEQAGAEYLEKPIRQQQLIETVERVISPN
jgi:FixJ family two-component response regulator